jgi:hypothetical protein
LAMRQVSPPTTTWSVYKIASKLVWLGAVEASDEATAMEKAAAAYKVPANRLMVIRRGLAIPSFFEIKESGGA